MITRLLISMVILGAAAGCGVGDGHHHEAPRVSSLDTSAADTSHFTHTGLSIAPEVCEGMRGFFADYTAAYLPGITASTTCEAVSSGQELFDAEELLEIGTPSMTCEAGRRCYRGRVNFLGASQTKVYFPLIVIFPEVSSDKSGLILGKRPSLPRPGWPSAPGSLMHDGMARLQATFQVWVQR